MDEDPVKVIVVDDLPDAAATLALLLELDGYKVRVAHDAQEALALIDSFAPHCMLFDIDMPGVDGYELCRNVRARHDSDIVLIAVTGHSTQDPRVVSAFAMADHYFSKPVDPALLRKLLPPLRG